MTLDLSTVDLVTEVLRTDRLVLRPYRPDDVDAVFAACQDPDNQRWLTIPSPYHRDDAVEFVTVTTVTARGRGYASEAAAALAAWGWATAPTASICSPTSGTPARRRSPGALASPREGTVRSCLPYRDGSHGDAALFSRLPGD